MSLITKEFIEQVLKQEVIEFETTSGSKLGDGFTTFLFSVKVTVQENVSSPPRRRHLILKCFPDELFWRKFLMRNNCFWREMSMYKIFIPALLDLYNSNPGSPRPVSPFPDIVFGNAVNYNQFSLTESLPPCHNLDNCIILPDLRSDDNGAYRMAYCRPMFDLDHLKLVIAQQAKYHSLSWAHKQRNKYSLLSEKFPFVKGCFMDGMEDADSEKMLDDATRSFLSVIEDCVQDAVERTRLIESVQKAREKLTDVSTLYLSDREGRPKSTYNKENILRVPLKPSNENEDPWLVATHGDAKPDNMLFRYVRSSEGTEKPVEVKFIDLQFAREGDPMTDIQWTIYSTTDSKFRKEHLDSLLQLYTETFLQICGDFDVAPPPGFQLSEVKRRFHRAKIFGFLVAIILFALTFTDYEKEGEVKGTNMDKDVMEDMKKRGDRVTQSPSFIKAVLEIVREFYEEGII